MAKKKSPAGPTEPPMSPELRKRLNAQESIRELFGTVEWEGDLSQMRKARFPAWQDGVEFGGSRKFHPLLNVDSASNPRSAPYPPACDPHP
jgi:hypothetical protein